MKFAAYQRRYLRTYVGPVYLQKLADTVANVMAPPELQIDTSLYENKPMPLYEAGVSQWVRWHCSFSLR